MLKGIFISETLGYSLQLEKSKKEKFVFMLLYMLGFYGIGIGTYQGYISWYIYAFIIFFIYSRKEIHKKSLQISILCMYLGIYELISILMNLATVIIVFFLPFEFVNTKSGIVVISALIRVYILFLCFNYFKEMKLNYEKILKNRYLIYILFLLVVFIKIPFLFTGITEIREWKAFILAICSCSVIFFVISQIERSKVAKEKARIEESNKALTAKLHKSREILPAVVQVLRGVTEKSGIEMEKHDTRKLLKEVNNLYGQQIKENVKEDIQLKNFCSTGLSVLDQQLNVYQYEAIEREYNLDIFVQEPIDGLVKRHGIAQLKLQRTIGDLVRNAFRAIGRRCEKNGHILLIIGCRYENILELAVMDNGAEIPLYVLETFGKRGVTTEGTGNGLADLREFAKDVKASIRIDEFREEEDLFTKKISVIFDGQNRYILDSSRREMIKSSIWNN